LRAVVATDAVELIEACGAECRRRHCKCTQCFTLGR
jgi:hypothetical protein